MSSPSMFRLVPHSSLFCLSGLLIPHLGYDGRAYFVSLFTVSDPWRCRDGSRFLALACRRAEAATFAHALAEFFALLRRHAAPAPAHATARAGAMPPAATHAAKEDPA